MAFREVPRATNFNFGKRLRIKASLESLAPKISTGLIAPISNSFSFNEVNNFYVVVLFVIL
jgi:hypothetical protein